MSEPSILGKEPLTSDKVLVGFSKILTALHNTIVIALRYGARCAYIDGI